MPLPPVVLLDPKVKTLAVQAMLSYNDLQKVGATDDPAPAPAHRVDNVIVADQRSQQYSQADPPVPLFLPLDKLDPRLSDAARAEFGITTQQAVFKQLGDNGLLPQFIANIQLFINKLITDKWLVGTRTSYGLTAPSTGASTYLLGITGQLPNSSGPGITGVPVDSTPSVANYVEILDGATGLPFVVLGGVDAGKRVYGLTTTGGTSPDSVQISLVCRVIGTDPDPAFTVPPPVSYVWEAGQPAAINLTYGFRQSLDQLDEVAFRRVFR